MRIRARSASVAVLSLTVALLAPAASAGVPLERVVVVLRDGTARPAVVAEDLARGAGGRVSQVWSIALRGFAAEVPAAAIDGLRRDPRVASVEADRIFTAFGEVPTGVDRIEADKKLSLDTTARNYASAVNTVKVAVAVIDTGIAAHPDLNLVGGADCASNTGCVTKLPGDGNGHGTHVAGTIGAKDDGVGVVGVIPGVDLYAVRVLGNNGSGYLSWIIAGLNWVAARAGTITTANMSLGAAGSDSALESAVRATIAAGVTIAVAAGNSGADAGGYTPARVTEAITVGAIADGDGKAGAAGTAAITCRSGEIDDRFATFSNYGSVVDLSAPGVCITSTWTGGSFATISGTSMATPHVAGAAALYRFENPTATPSQIQTALKGSWAASQGGSCGYAPYGSRTGGPLLMLATCDVASGGVTLSPPAAFSKTAPANGATASVKGGGVTLSWAAANGATSYRICLNSASNCATTTNTSYRLIGLTKGSASTWQVTALNAAGSTEANGGTWWTFTPV